MKCFSSMTLALQNRLWDGLRSFRTRSPPPPPPPPPLPRGGWEPCFLLPPSAGGGGVPPPPGPCGFWEMFSSASTTLCSTETTTGWALPSPSEKRLREKSESCTRFCCFAVKELQGQVLIRQPWSRGGVDLGSADCIGTAPCNETFFLNQGFVLNF